jgi:hypothetical protein
MPDSTLTAAERTFLAELARLGVRFMVVGMSGALIQGARGATEDIDLWFEDVTDVRIADAARASGGICAYAAVVAMARKAPRCPPIAGSAQALRPHEA